LVSLPSFAAQPAHPYRAKLQPCTAQRDGEDVDGFCGQYQVWENRAAKTGRKITLKVLVLPALGPDPKPDPIVGLGGGPGQPASELTWMMSTEARQDRDFLFVDQRGTGEPDQLTCLLGEPGDLQSLFTQLFPVDAVRRCREELGKKYDLTQYTTAGGADDLDEVRAWLGYDKLNLAGYSYGTRMAQVYLKRHPGSVRTVTLWGSLPMDEALPISHAAAGQRSLDLLFELCEQDAACNAKFPVRKDFQAVMARLDAAPVEVEAPHPETGKPTKVRLPREVVAETIRSLLYDARRSAALPLAFHEAAAGDWKRLGEMLVAQRYGSVVWLTQGLFFSVTCAEDMPYITEEMIAARTAGSFLRDDRVRRQKAACDLWPRAAVEPGHREAARTDVPVLAINGRFDPVTPPEMGRRAIASYSHSLFLEVPYESHAISGDCPVGIAETFIDRGSLQGLDTSCLAATKPTPFVLEPPPPSRPLEARLRPCKVPVWDFSTKEETPGDALCGSYEVWENREAKAGRKISLRIVVLPALSPSPLPDPVLVLSGGPGGAATQGVYGSGLRQERDLVFIDQRGSGEPDRLGCHLAKEGDLQGELGELFPLDAVRRCRDELGKKYDLARYSVAEAVDDFDEIMHWLGYGKVNLIGSSYGTRTAQVYLRRHPESVRTAVLWGVLPMDEPVPLSHASGAQRSLDLVLGMCEKDAACHAKLPDPRKDFQAVMDRVSRGPVEVEVADPKTKKATRVRLSREAVTDGIRLILYSAESAAALPFFFHRAAAGDWKLLGQAVVTAKAGLEEVMARGLFFSVTCGQDLPFIDPAEVPARTAGTFFGEFRVRQQTAACALWPHAQIAPADREAIRSDVPVLLINGDLDPVTPPDFGRRAARFLTRSLLVAEPYAGHEESPPCVEALANGLVRRGTPEGLDVDACVRQLEPVPFVLEPPEKEIKPFL
jgi:pimeloyl-ACP methyl ester carboxylesterase